MLSILSLSFLISFGQADSFLRRNEVPVSGIPTIRVEIPYYPSTPEGESPLSLEELTSLGLWQDKKDALAKCQSSYESLLERIQKQIHGVIVMKMERCQLSGPHRGYRGPNRDGEPYTFYRYDAYVSFLQSVSKDNKSSMEVTEAEATSVDP